MKLSRKAKEELLELIEEKIRRQRMRKIDGMYPEDGALSRHNYPKHMSFFEAGIRYRERCMLAGNRCITPWTHIETDHAMVLPIDILYEREFYVRSWDGDSRCTKKASSLFLKSISPAFRLLLDNGEFFDCTYMHRVLTNEGWVSVGQIIHDTSGLSFCHTRQDYQGSCGRDTYQCDALLPSELSNVQGQFPLVPDAQKSVRFFDTEDEEGHRFQYNHVYQSFFPHSNICDPDTISALFGKFGDPKSLLDVLWPISLRQELSLFVHELAQRREDSLALTRQFLEESFLGEVNGVLFVQDMLAQQMVTIQGKELYLSHFPSGGYDPQLHHGTSYTEIFFPYQSPYSLVGGQQIVAIVPIGLQPIIDITVPDVNCYFSGGVIHHNTGKTEGVGGYELTCHLTGKYPSWWEGKRFDKAVMGWAAGNTNQTTRDILQAKLLGPINDMGTGLIPGDDIVDTKRRSGSVPDTIETAYVKHVSGGTSVLGFKSYEQGRKAFEGTEQDVILLDEEPPEDIYTECLIRTMTTKGLIMLTFTPLQGMSSVVLMFLPGGRMPDGETGKFVVSATWDDAPHLTEEDKKELLASMMPYQRDARSKGIPSLGSGAIYPIDEDDLLIDPFDLPIHFPRVYGMDVGWNWTAALWGAIDRDNDMLYLYSEYKRGHAEPAVHKYAIDSRGEWIPGVIDPASSGAGQRDGISLMNEYSDLGLKLIPANNGVEAGTFAVWSRMSTGRIKVFNSLRGWLEEFRLYRRNEKGKIVKENDHLMDCMRYLCISGISVAEFPSTSDSFLTGNSVMSRLQNMVRMMKTKKEEFNSLTDGMR